VKSSVHISPIQIIVPFRPDGAKSRLSPVLSPNERYLLAIYMLKDVLSVASVAGKITILSRPYADRGLMIPGAKILCSDLDLNDALNELIQNQSERGWPDSLLIIMADMPLLTIEDVQGIIKTDGDIVLSPSRNGGTNMILIRNSKFRTCYNGSSFIKHLELARRMGLKVGIYSSHNSMCDIDIPADMKEILSHGKGKTRTLLNSLGFGSKKKNEANLI
jgi:2-phospho-L-lactate guanylyltransferase